MVEEAGGEISFAASGVKLDQYTQGDVTSAVYSQSGALVDWAYGAGWDRETEAARTDCTPGT